VTTVQIIDDYSTRILLRHLGGREPIPVDAPRVDAGSDLEFLQCHWAISRPVRVLAEYVLENRHEAQSILTFRPRVDDAIARGRIDARATLIHRLRSGLPTAVVAAEPIRSFQTGPNEVLGWVMRHSWQLASRFLSWQKEGTLYDVRSRETLHLFDQVRRIEAIRIMIGQLPTGRRPAAASQTAARRSRKRMYRLAMEAYERLVAIEHGDRDVIAEVLNDTLLGPLEAWRRLELAVGLAFGNAIGAEMHQPVLLKLLGIDASGPIVRCGRFSIYWQAVVAQFYNEPEWEPSEVRAAEILAAYGIHEGTERPDLVIVDEEAQRVVGIIEVKMHEGDDPTSQFRAAIHQLVRYARGYENSAQVLGGSAVAMNVSVPSLQVVDPSVPGSFSFDHILADGLRPWVTMKWLA
jgi:hypothetical protein